MAKKADATLLDVDRSILENQLLLQGSGGEELNMFPWQEKQPDYPYKVVTPSPGFCVKMKKTSGEKVFINICQTSEVPAPDDVSEEEVAEMLTSDDSNIYKIPMSLQEPREDLDKSGNPSTVCDVAINPEFLKKIESKEFFKNLLLTAVMEAMEHKFEFQLDRSGYVILKNRKNLGKLLPHRIQQRNQPLIQEVGTAPPRPGSSMEPRREQQPSKPLITEIDSRPAQTNIGDLGGKVPEFKIVQKPVSGQPEYLVAEFKMKDVITSKDLTLDVGEDRIILEGRRSRYFLDIFLPFLINQEECKARFNKQKGVLTLIMPVAG